MIVVITSFIKHQNRSRLSNWNLLIRHLNYSRSYYIYIYISFYHIGQFVTFGFAKSFVHAMSSHLQRNFLPYIQKGDSIAGVDYLKVRNDVINCKTIISDRSQIHAAPNFSLLSSCIAEYVTIICYTLLHQATRDEGKTSLWRRFFVSDRDPQRFFCINLWCAILLQVI